MHVVGSDARRDQPLADGLFHQTAGQHAADQRTDQSGLFIRGELPRDDALVADSGLDERSGIDLSIEDDGHLLALVRAGQFAEVVGADGVKLEADRGQTALVAGLAGTDQFPGAGLAVVEGLLKRVVAEDVIDAAHVVEYALAVHHDLLALAIFLGRSADVLSDEADQASGAVGELERLGRRGFGFSDPEPAVLGVVVVGGFQSPSLEHLAERVFVGYIIAARDGDPEPKLAGALEQSPEVRRVGKRPLDLLVALPREDQVVDQPHLGPGLAGPGVHGVQEFVLGNRFAGIQGIEAGEPGLEVADRHFAVAQPPLLAILPDLDLALAFRIALEHLQDGGLGEVQLVHGCVVRRLRRPAPVATGEGIGQQQLIFADGLGRGRKTRSAESRQEGFAPGILPRAVRELDEFVHCRD